MKNIIEISKGDYARFDDMSGLVKAMSRNQKVWSWGAHGWTNMEGKFLKFRVSGHLFKGIVYIGVNGRDLFDVFFTNLKGEVKDELNDVFIDDLIDSVDGKVEKIPSYAW